MKAKLILPLLLLAGLLLGSDVQAQIFVTNAGQGYVDGSFTDNGFVGEYSLSGSAVNASLVTGLNLPQGITVAGSDLFVAANEAGGFFGEVGQYSTSGAPVGSGTLVGSDYLNDPYGVAVSGSDVFVINSGNSTIGEYTTSGSMVNNSLISTGLDGPRDVAVSGSYIFVANAINNTIAEYTTSGSLVNASLISSGLDYPTGIAVSGSYIFVANTNGESIGEYTTSGSTVNATLVSSGLGLPESIAISGTDIFVVNFGSSSVGEYTTSGSMVNGALITGLNNPFGITVAGAAGAPAAITPTSQTTGISAGTSYSTVAPVTAAGGFGSTAVIAGGTATASSNVNVAFSGSGNYANIASDLVTVSGMPNKGTGSSGQTLTDTFVLELSFDGNAANEIAGGSGALSLLWLNPATGQWVNAVLGNSDGGAGASTETLSEMESAYNPAVDDNLSWYGVDVADGYVWAVVDHSSTFTTGNPIDTPFQVAIPEPSTWTLLAIGGVGMLFSGRNRRKRSKVLGPRPHEGASLARGALS